MSLKSKRELLEVVRPRYLQAGKAGKQKMLDEFTSATGYHRKYAIRILKKQVQKRPNTPGGALEGKSKGCKAIYRGAVAQALEQTWEIYGHICSKRLQPFSLAPTARTVCQQPLECWNVAKKSNFPKIRKNCS